MKIDNKASERIKATGFLCALLVVTIHSATLADDMPRAVRILQNIGTNTVSRLAVPWFFVISGFFLANKAFEENTSLSIWYRMSLHKRLMSLAIPYFLWNVIYYVFKILTGKCGFDVWHCFAQITGLDYGGYSPACGQFWYVRCLFVYILLSPVFVAAIWRKWVGFTALAVLAVLWLFGASPLVRHIQPFNWSYMLFFGSGLWIARHGVDDFWHNGVLKTVLAVVFVISSVFVVFDMAWGRMAERSMILSGLPLMWFCSKWIVQMMNPMRGLWSLAFFVYAAHVIFISVTNTVLLKVMSVGPVYHFVGYLGKIFCSIAACLALGWLMRKYAAKLLALLSGGRS